MLKIYKLYLSSDSVFQVMTYKVDRLSLFQLIDSQRKILMAFVYFSSFLLLYMVFCKLKLLTKFPFKA